MNSSLAYSLDEDSWEEKSWEELIDGKVVAMSPRPTISHNIVANNIFRILANYLHGKPCRPFDDGTALHLTKKDHFIPDGMVVCDKNKMKRTFVEGAPDLVVEVLSPGTARRDRGYKKDVYERCGVREYWIVSPAEFTVEQYVPENGVFVMRDICQHYPSYMLEDMTEEERSRAVRPFHCTLFPDLEIRTEDIFYWVSEA